MGTQKRAVRLARYVTTYLVDSLAEREPIGSSAPEWLATVPVIVRQEGPRHERYRSNTRLYGTTV
jgi:hypothetical protein